MHGMEVFISAILLFNRCKGAPWLGSVPVKPMSSSTIVGSIGRSTCKIGKTQLAFAVELCSCQVCTWHQCVAADATSVVDAFVCRCSCELRSMPTIAVASRGCHVGPDSASPSPTRQRRPGWQKRAAAAGLRALQLPQARRPARSAGQGWTPGLPRRCAAPRNASAVLRAAAGAAALRRKALLRHQHQVVNIVKTGRVACQQH